MYNREEIEKNFFMLGKCTDECLAKLAEVASPADADLLEQRIETTLSLADFFVDSVKTKYAQDGYITKICEEISNCGERYNKYKVNKAIQQLAEQTEEKQLVAVNETACLPA